MYPYVDFHVAKAIVEERVRAAQLERQYREALARGRGSYPREQAREWLLAKALRSLRALLARRPVL